MLTPDACCAWAITTTRTITNKTKIRRRRPILISPPHGTATVKSAGLSLTFKRLRVVPRISGRVEINKAFGTFEFLTDQIALRARQSAPAKAFHKLFSVMHAHVGADRVLQQKRLGRLRVAPIVRAVAVNHR